MSRSAIVICTDEPIGVISPLLHGQFAEHLGRCCYDGLWVGQDSSIENINGFRVDIIDAIRHIGVPLLRWPGGCFADTYHWREGIGPAEKRPRTLAESCGCKAVETNEIGTHEFIDLCRMIGAEPYLAGNVGSGSPQEMMDWVQYSNATSDTLLVRERIANGHKDPMHVKYWGVGNESWACGGNYDAEDYGKEFKRYATFIKQIDSNVELVACGDHDPEWNAAVIDANRKHLALMDHISIHRYWASGPALDFTEDEYYNLQRGPDVVDNDIRLTDEILRRYETNKPVRIAFDEWGVWHPEAGVCNGLEAPSTMRDAVTAAGTFDVFHKWCNRLSMANIAQVVNVLQAMVQTDGPKMWLTPTYHVFDMYKVHRGAAALKVDIKDAAVRNMPAVAGKFPVPNMEAGDLNMISVSASIKESGLFVSVSNRSYDDSTELEISLKGQQVSHGVVSSLYTDNANAINTAETPHRVEPKCSDAQIYNDKIRLDMPPCSVHTLMLRLK